GGHMGALYQPVELLIIGGAAIGAFLAANSGKSLKATLRTLPTLLRTSRYDKGLYMELMALLYVLLTKARREGMMTLESHIEDPQASAVFGAYPNILADTHLVEFIT